ncbi:hypothetical protein [Deinococcus petrolearius]|uniref:Uncharacterized protein n=1 Tax=Deinococcus petrolearius TaxID=1751295 RepID=A0ABW1DL33_9DEIO
MKRQTGYLLTAVSLTMTAFLTAGAQANVKTYGLSDAMNLGVTVTLGKFDPGIIEMPCAISNVGLTLPDAIDANYSGSLLMLMSKTSTTRAPLVVMCDNGSFARINVQGAGTKGSSVYVRIVDDKPQPASARELAARPAAAAVVTPVAASIPAPAPLVTTVPAPAASAPAPAPLVTAVPGAPLATGVSTPAMYLPAPSTLTMTATNTDQNTLELTVSNKTALTMEFQPAQLRVLVDGSEVTVPSNVSGALAPGLSMKFSLPYTGPRGNVTATWNAYAPAIKTFFTLKQ